MAHHDVTLPGPTPTWSVKEHNIIHHADDTISFANVHRYHPTGIDDGGLAQYEIAHIRVSMSQRGQGHGSALLRMICDEADKHGITLWLEARAVDAANALSQADLEAWYVRHGFEPVGMIYRRKPQTRGDGE